MVERAQVTTALARPTDTTETSIVGSEFLAGRLTASETPVLGLQCKLNASGGLVEVRRFRTT